MTSAVVVTTMLLLVFAISRFAVASETSNVISSHNNKPDGECVLGGDVHQVGDTWHPYLEPFGFMNCTTCYCQPGGSVSCWRETCPDLACEHAATPPGYCCPVCPDDAILAGELPDDDYDQSLLDEDNDLSAPDPLYDNNLPDDQFNDHNGAANTEEADDRTTEDDVMPVATTRRSCEHYGEVFMDGERFSSARTNLNPRDDQCVQCVCLDGEIYCHLKTCFSSICTTTIPTTDDCCPVCADCVTDDIIYKNGSTWHPVVETVGEVPCITCSCLNGDFTCVRQQCPDEASLPCDNPTVAENQCCKSCPEEDTNRPIQVGVGLPTGPRGVLPDSGRALSGLPIRSDDELAKNQRKLPCPPPGSSTLVHQWRSKTALILAFQFRMSTVIYSFSINKGKVLAVSSQWLSRVKFSALIRQLRGVTILGATTTKRVEKFRRRVRRKFNNCQPNCRTKYIRRLARSLRLRHATGKC